MGRANSAGRKEIIIARTQRIDRSNNLGGGMGDNPRLAKVDPDLCEVIGDIRDILIFRAARKDLVADDKERRRYGFLRHGRSPRRLLAEKSSDFDDFEGP